MTRHPAAFPDALIMRYPGVRLQAQKIYQLGADQSSLRAGEEIEECAVHELRVGDAVGMAALRGVGVLHVHYHQRRRGGVEDDGLGPRGQRHRAEPPRRIPVGCRHVHQATSARGASTVMCRRVLIRGWMRVPNSSSPFRK